MLSGKPLNYRFVIGIVLGGIVAFPLGAFGARAFFSLNHGVNANSPSKLPTGRFLVEGFDFNLFRTP